MENGDNTGCGGCGYYIKFHDCEGDWWWDCKIGAGPAANNRYLNCSKFYKKPMPDESSSIHWYGVGVTVVTILLLALIMFVNTGCDALTECRWPKDCNIEPYFQACIERDKELNTARYYNCELTKQHSHVKCKYRIVQILCPDMIPEKYRCNR